MQVEDAYATLANAHPDFCRFYGPAAGLSVGVGLVVRRLAYPFYDKQLSEFSVGIGRAYVISHECDIDIANDRPFNDMAVVVPVIPLELLISRYLEGRTEEQTRGFIAALAKRTVDRAVYIPTIADELPHGGVLYINAMSHTHVSEFSKPGVEACCAVSVFGLRYLDAALSHALLKRPKAEPLPLAGDLERWSTDPRPTARRAIMHLISALRDGRF